jgi:hypothetical protein
MLKFASIMSEFLLEFGMRYPCLSFVIEFGMRYPCLSFVIDKYRLLIRC